MLTDVGDDEEESPLGPKKEDANGEKEKEKEDWEGVQWEELVSPTKRVLSMDVSQSSG